MPQSSFEIGTQFTATGTVAITNGSAVITGTGTSFLSQFSPGYLVQVASQWRVVLSVASDTSMTMTANFTTTASGQTAIGANLKNLENLATPVDPPKSTFLPFGEYAGLGNGALRGLGSPQASWFWEVQQKVNGIPQAQRDMLRTFCPGASAAVYIRTRTNDQQDTFKYFQTQMLWPQGAENKDFLWRVNFTIEFRAMVELATS